MAGGNGQGRRVAEEFRRDGAVHASPRLGLELREAGLEWTPRLHDLFMIPDRDLDDRVFALSDMTIDLEHFAGNSTIMFNGAVEWSLDYIVEQHVVWLPTEGQLRSALGERFVGLERTDGGWMCTVDGHEPKAFAGESAVEAYGRALLSLLQSGHRPTGR